MQDLSKPHNLSFWELDSVFNNIDLVVVGSGIVGLNAALHYKTNNKNAKVVVLERGVMPYGASTKNAGFACFGSASEIIADIKNVGEDAVWQTVKMRIDGLEKLKQIVGEQNMKYTACGGFELFFNERDFENYHAHLPFLNDAFESFFHCNDIWKNATTEILKLGFANTFGMLMNTAEGAIDTGSMMHTLHKICITNDIIILNNIQVNNFNENWNGVELNINEGLNVMAKKLIIASNGFAKQLLPNYDVTPARAQVLITKPIKNLMINGTFHFDEGYYYFRNVGKRVLFGGARNIDINGETTTDFGTTNIVQENLLKHLQDTILPNTPFEIEHTWSGIMGVGNDKKPIIKSVSKNIYCSVRMGGMGVAIGSLAGIEVAKLAL
jgi:gamma-glutamylputrescine oxidase